MFSRFVLGGAVEADLDKLGRVLVPDYLKQYAGLNKKVIVAGLYNRVEIWDEDKWNAYKKQTESEAGDIAERLKDLKITKELVPLENLVRDLWGGLASYVSYSGYNSLTNAIGNGVFEVKENSLPPRNRV